MTSQRSPRLIQDIPEARVWATGYHTDAISGLFQANNKNSVSQHSMAETLQCASSRTLRKRWAHVHRLGSEGTQGACSGRLSRTFAMLVSRELYRYVLWEI